MFLIDEDLTSLIILKQLNILLTTSFRFREVAIPSLHKIEKYLSLLKSKNAIQSFSHSRIRIESK